MVKTKRALTVMAAIIIFFTMALGFAGCRDEEKKITYMIYVSDRWLTGLTNVTDAEIMEGVMLLCEIKDGDEKEITLQYDEEIYNRIYVRYMMPGDDYTLFTCSGAKRFYSVDYWNLDGDKQEKKPETLKRGTYIYRCEDCSYDIPLENYYARHFFAQMKLVVI